MMTKLYWFICGATAVLAGLYGPQLTKHLLTPSSEILKPTFSPAPKRYVIWSRKDFLKKPGQVNVMSESALSAMGAKNIKQLELINGSSFEVDEDAKRKIQALALTGKTDFVIQEEYYHHILTFTCSRSETIPCPVTPGPTPVPTPTPQPGPTPTPAPTPGPIEADKSWGRARVHAKEAQAVVDTSQVKICDVDTGIDLQHPNRGNVVATQDFTGKGSVQDGAGHGTHTAGTLAGTGGVGVSKAKLFVCKGLSDSGGGTSSALAQCLAWCGQQGAQIVSNSWGSTQSDQMINSAINSLTQRGTYVFVAAGNDSGDVNWPAKLSGSNPLVYAIAASDQSDQITSFSSRGPEVRFISPGAGIISNWPGGGTRSLDGTSMATPHAAAICAFGIAHGRRPCVNPSGSIAGYPFADAAASAQ